MDNLELEQANFQTIAPPYILHLLGDLWGIDGDPERLVNVKTVSSLFFLFLLVSINFPEGFHHDIFIHRFEVLWSNTPHILHFLTLI
jgi:hypothetical protein